MLIAVEKQLARAFPGARLAIRTNKIKEPAPSELKIYQKPTLSENFIGDLVLRIRFKKKEREDLQIILDSEIDAVFDASGFKYSDFFGHTAIYRQSKRIRRWKKTGKKVILLPQAFGPLKVPRVRKAMKIIAKNADLIYARDPESRNHLIGVLGERNNIKTCPDFTILVKETISKNPSTQKSRACLVPNSQMLAKTEDKAGESYIPFMASCADFLKEKDLDPFILLHQTTDDRLLARKIQEVAQIDLEVFEEEDPIKLKALIGKCHFVVGSRFHALASALSQGVPAMGVGWSHKYKQLFNEYGCPHLLISDLNFQEDALGKLQALMRPENHRELALTLSQLAKRQEQEVLRMWDEVFTLIFK